jgi:hypothetical protein
MVMPLNELPKIFGPDTLALMETALENAWQERKNDGGVADATSARRTLAKTIIALAAVGETDLTKLKKFALHASRAAATVGRAALALRVSLEDPSG